MQPECPLAHGDNPSPQGRGLILRQYFPLRTGTDLLTSDVPRKAAQTSQGLLPRRGAGYGEELRPQAPHIPATEDKKTIENDFHFC